MQKESIINDCPNKKALIFAALQWFFFMIANMITVPILLGQAFGMSQQDITMYTERTFFVCGIVGLLQAIGGHRLPILEAPAGMWWGVYIILIQMAKDQGTSLQALLQQIEFGLIAGALVFILLGIFKRLDKVRRLFTPVVSGTFLILLSLQLAKTLIAGILGIGFHNQTFISIKVTVLSISVIALTIFLSLKGRGIVRSLSILISMVIGWALFALFGLVDSLGTRMEIFMLPSPFPFGVPEFNAGITITCVITSVILLANLIASIQAFALAAGKDITNETFNRGALVTGIGTLLMGLWGGVGAMPMASTAGFVATTRMSSRLPFIIASVSIMLMGFFPFLGSWLSILPTPLGYAIMLVIFAQLIGIGLHNYKTLLLDQRDAFVVGLSTLCGVGIFGIPSASFHGIPPAFIYILDNGLIVGVLAVLLFEHVIFKRNMNRN